MHPMKKRRLLTHLSKHTPLLIAAIVAMSPFGTPNASAAPIPPQVFTPLFNGSDLSGWYGMNQDPRKLWALSKEDQAKFRDASMADFKKHWTVEGDDLVNDGHGDYATTVREYGDYELLL